MGNFYRQPNLPARPLISGLSAFVIFFAAGLLIIGSWNLLAASRRIAVSAAGQNETVRQNLENLLAEKVQSVLEKVAGKGKTRTQVNLELDFATVATDEEIYDPEGQIIRSYTQSDNFASQVKYEINKVTRSRLLNGIAIKKISAVVLVDSIYEKTGDGRLIYRNRSSDEMAQLEALIKPVIGFDARRGDVLKLENIHFAEAEPAFDYRQTAEIILLLAVTALAFWLARSLRPRRQDVVDDGADLNTIMDENPNAAAEAVRRWLNEDSRR